MALDRSVENREPTESPTGAELLLRGLKRSGIEYIFANSGTDFPPIIEAFAALDTAVVAALA
jgi:acetolactate synthase-1/2/3 large subunit